MQQQAECALARHYRRRHNLLLLHLHLHLHLHLLPLLFLLLLLHLHLHLHLPLLPLLFLLLHHHNLLLLERGLRVCRRLGCLHGRMACISFHQLLLPLPPCRAIPP